ncbi:MAG: hypothetical protein AB1405_03315 [Bdellovibrionota bacterium]
MKLFPKYVLLLLLSLAFFRCTRETAQETSSENEKPMVIRMLAPGAATAGGTAKIRIEFLPRATVKVPIYPSAYADKIDVFTGLEGPTGRVLARVLTPEEEEKGRLAYYEGDPPAVEIPVKIPAGAEPGAYPFSGEANYFYCYETGGICAKESERFEGVIDVTAGASK